MNTVVQMRETNEIAAAFRQAGHVSRLRRTVVGLVVLALAEAAAIAGLLVFLVRVHSSP